MTEEIKKLIADSKNIYIVSKDEPEAQTAALALFYTLKELGKNVNVLIESLPENLNFLSPSLDFVSYPKNFVVAIPNKVAQVSQIYYEKNDEALKIHLTLSNGSIKKENIAFYFSETKPDLVITIGVKDYSKELEGKLQSFGFLLDSTIINIDSLPVNKMDAQENKKFGKINIVETKPLAQITLELFENIPSSAANCFLSSLIIYTDNFKQGLSAEVFEIAAMLMKKGADLKQITENIYKGHI